VGRKGKDRRRSRAARIGVQIKRKMKIKETWGGGTFPEGYVRMRNVFRNPPLG
jgi:hypothetical protein